MENPKNHPSIILIGLATILISLTACGSPAQTSSTKQPAAIEDPMLLEAWKLLNEHVEPVQLWDGRTLSGHDLAQFVLVNAIPVIWDTENRCGGSSCSLKFCRSDGCSYADKNPGVDPIYIATSIQSLGEGSLTSLVETLAHEIFHRTEPFGMGMPTMLEEYTAFFVETQISGATWTNTTAYNPLQPACLTRWFSDHNLLYGYEQLDAYPESVVGLVDNSTQDCLLSGEEPDTPHAVQVLPTSQPQEGNYTLDCQTNPLGLLVCQRRETQESPTQQERSIIP